MVIPSILRQFGDLQEQQEYWLCIQEILRIARITAQELSGIELNMKSWLKTEEVETLHECFSEFMVLCRTSGYRPSHYWNYLESSMR